MRNPINGVKKFSNLIFVIFVLSKILMGIGLGALLATWILPYAWWILGVGVVVTLICCSAAWMDAAV